MATTPRGYVYQDDINAPNNIPGDLQALAESVDADVATLETATKPGSTTSITAASGYTWAGGGARIRGNLVEFMPAQISRASTSVSLSIGAANAALIGTLPAGHYPVSPGAWFPAIIRYGDASTAVQVCEIRINTGGSIQVQVAASGTLTTSGYIAIPAQAWLKS